MYSLLTKLQELQYVFFFYVGYFITHWKNTTKLILLVISVLQMVCWKWKNLHFCSKSVLQVVNVWAVCLGKWWWTFDIMYLLFWCLQTTGVIIHQSKGFNKECVIIHWGKCTESKDVLLLIIFYVFIFEFINRLNLFVAMSNTFIILSYITLQIMNTTHNRFILFKPWMQISSKFWKLSQCVSFTEKYHVLRFHIWNIYSVTKIHCVSLPTLVFVLNKSMSYIFANVSLEELFKMRFFSDILLWRVHSVS